MKLENWAVVYTGFARLSGNVYDDPRFPDGTKITTTQLVYIEDGLVCTKTGSVYELGTVLPEYEALFPNARERLLRQRKENANDA